MSKQHLMPVNVKPAQIFTHGSGAYLFDDAGRRYLDWVQGWAVNCLGHSPPVLVDAIAHQAATLIHPSPAYYNVPALKLAGLLARHSGLGQVFFASSGAEANEGAIKLARKWGRLHKHGAHRIITFEQGFHGRTLATMSATGKPGWDTLFAPQVPGFDKAVFNDLASVAALITADTVAVMLEPVQGEAGVIVAERGFLQGLRQLCDAHGLLLILDEVQTGCGRTGTLFAAEHDGVLPDIMTLGKGLGGGVPLSALLAKDAVSCFAAGDQGGTFSGNPLACAAACAVLEALTAPGFLDQSRQVGEHLRRGLQALSDRHRLAGVRGRGMLWALDLGKPCGSEMVAAGLAAGLLINAPRPNCLRFMPALNTSMDEVAAGLACLEQILSA